MKYLKTLEDFESMIGKKIYRQSDGCECSTCKEIVQNGFIVRDIEHAKYLHMVQGELDIEYSIFPYKKPHITV